ncbi:MAG: N-acetylglucosamine-6-phosphate deacetylase [Rhodospirillaceae bacterium]
MDAFLSARLFTGDEMRRDAAALVEGGIVHAVVAAAAIPAGARRIDLGDALLAPGFIDLQVNGGGGTLFNDDPSLAALARIAAAHRRFGTTGLLPTLISASRDRRLAARAAVAEALALGMPGILGLHLEGPHLNPERRGVHEARWFAPPEAEDLALMAPLPGGVTLVTLAPEVVPPETIASLATGGTVLAAGHSAASYETTRAALAAGVSGFTHLFNAMPAMTSREPGIVGAALDDRTSWCGLIADGHHLHDATLRLVWRAKPKGALVLVTDAMPPVGGDAAGAPIESFRLGDELITVSGGSCLSATGRLAGSALDMATAVRRCVTRIGIPLEEALAMASTNPARALGISDRRGRIAAGLRADFVVLDADLRVRETYLNGRS